MSGCPPSNPYGPSAPSCRARHSLGPLTCACQARSRRLPTPTRNGSQCGHRPRLGGDARSPPRVDPVTRSSATGRSGDQTHPREVDAPAALRTRVGGTPRGGRRRSRRGTRARGGNCSTALPDIPPPDLAQLHTTHSVGAVAPAGCRCLARQQNRGCDREGTPVDGAGLPQPRGPRIVGSAVQRSIAATAARRIDTGQTVLRRVRPRRHLHQSALRRFPASLPHRSREQIRPTLRKSRNGTGRE